MATKDDIADLRREMATKDDINRLDTKLTKFEEREIDKRLQLEVRVSAIEKHLGLDKKIAACPTPPPYVKQQHSLTEHNDHRIDHAIVLLPPTRLPDRH